VRRRRGSSGGSGDDDRPALRRSVARRDLGVAAFKDCLQGVARLGYAGEIEGRRGLRGGRLGAAAGAAAILEIISHPLGLVGVDGAGVRLSGHADRFKRVQNGLALYFQFSG